MSPHWDSYSLPQLVILYKQLDAPFAHLSASKCPATNTTVQLSLLCVHTWSAHVTIHADDVCWQPYNLAPKEKTISLKTGIRILKTRVSSGYNGSFESFCWSYRFQVECHLQHITIEGCSISKLAWGIHCHINGFCYPQILLSRSFQVLA